MVSPPAQEGVFKNSHADPSFVSDMLVKKFMLHLPVNRQQHMLKDAGILLNRATMNQWVNRAASLPEQINEAQLRSVLDGAVLQMDETPVRAGHSPDRHKMKTGYMWPVLGDRNEVVFTFAESRAHGHVHDILGDWSGTLISDGYGAYAAYVEARNGAVRHQSCWSHARRKIAEQKDNWPDMVAEALSLIGRIYRIEGEIKDRPHHERMTARQTRSRAAVDAFWEWCQRRLDDPKLTPKHPIRKAIDYAMKRRSELETFLDDPDVSPDTNRIENAIRPIKLGQKNWLFAWNETGARSAAIVAGLLATCRMHDVDPQTWLNDVLLRIATHPASRVDELTPRRWKTLFADNPMTSDVAALAAQLLRPNDDGRGRSASGAAPP